MRYCRKCLEPDTRPDCIFDDEGVCLPCRYSETLGHIDWQGRRRELDEIAEWGRRNTKSNYDCIIGVSGGKDSHRQALYARDELGLRVLLVSCTYPPEQQTERGAHNLANLCELGFDTIQVSPAPERWRQLMRFGILEFANWCKSTEMALYASVPRVAIAYQTPLIFLGENPALAWGSAGGSLDGDANRMKYNNTLQGGDLTPYFKAGMTDRDLFWYRYPTDDEMTRANLRLVYLGYYIHDFNDYKNAEIAMAHGMMPRSGEDARPEVMGQINPFDALDDDFVAVNQMLKYIKLGFGKVTEQVSGAIRHGVMTREEAQELARLYDGVVGDKILQRFCRYIGLSEDEFRAVVDRFRNQDLFERNGDGWRLKDPPY
ncbi:N-acetyl sugar amidotransferase [Azospirillum sp. Marseille-Q6669]